jgi:3-oxoacyl-[acyl-carrier protein] reductase
MADFNGQVALVTGASRGIGRATALALAEAGANVAVNYAHNKAAAAEVVKLIEGMGRTARAYAGDISDAAIVAQFVAQVYQDFGRIDILVNNAAINRDHSFTKMTTQEWVDVINTDLNGPFHVSHLVVPKMAEAGGGRVIFVTSMVGQIGAFGQANYGAAKAGLIGLMRTLAREYARKNVLVNAVAPGYTETDMTSGIPEKVMESIKSQIPLGRMARAEEVAGAIAFLAGPSATYITGQVLSVNGGMFIGR